MNRLEPWMKNRHEATRLLYLWLWQSGESRWLSIAEGALFDAVIALQQLVKALIYGVYRDADQVLVDPKRLKECLSTIAVDESGSKAALDISQLMSIGSGKREVQNGKGV